MVGCLKYHQSTKYLVAAMYEHVFSVSLFLSDLLSFSMNKKISSPPCYVIFGWTLYSFSSH